MDFHDVVLLERLPCLGRKREITGLERFEVRRMIVDTRIKVYYLIYERSIYHGGSGHETKSEGFRRHVAKLFGENR